MKKFLPALIVLILICVVGMTIHGSNADRLILIGGNTVCKYEDDSKHIIKKSGWSEYIENYIDSNIKILDLSKRDQTLEDFVNSERIDHNLKKLSTNDIIILQLEAGDFDSDSLKNNISQLIDLSSNKQCKLYVVLPFIENIGIDANLTDKISEVMTLLEKNNITIMSPMLLGYLYGHDEKHVLSYYKDKELGYDYEGLNCLYADAAAGYISNVVYKENDSFPQSSYRITRSMFVGQLIRLSECELKNEYAFNDVYTNNEFYAEIATAKAMNIISGYSDGSFHPDDEITLSDASVISVKLLKYLNGGYDKFGFYGSESDPKVQQSMSQYQAEKKDIAEYAIPYAYDLSLYYGASTVWYSDKLSKNICIADIYQLFYDEVYE